MKTNTRTTRTVLNLFVLLALLTAALGMPTNAGATAPSNDDILNAIPFATAPDTKTMDETTFNDAGVAFDDPQASCTGFPYLHSVWYSFTPSTYGNTTIDTYGSNFDTVLAVWTGIRGNLQEVACSDDNPITGALQSEVKFSAKAGTKYYIEVMQFRTNSPIKIDRPVDPLAVTDYMTLNVSFTQDLTIGEPGIKYDDKSAIFTYFGTWLTTNSAKAYAGSFKLSKVIGNSAKVTFAGNQFKLYYTKYIQYGRLDMYLDGSTTPLAQLSQAGTTAYAYQQVYTSPVFADGIHTLELQHGTKYVSIDAIEFTAPPDLVPPSAVTDLAAVPGATYGSVDLTWTASGDDGTDGVAKYYEVRYSTSPISNESAWSTATPVTSGVPTPKPAGQTETMSVTGFAPNLTYHFAVKVFDEPAPDSTGSGLSNSASATTSGPPPAPVGTYDDKLDIDKWVYIGTWTNVNTTSAYKSSYRWANVIGNSASFVFNGSKFTFLYTVTSAGGTVDVRVDGVSVGTINMKSSITRYKQKFIYNVSPGNHTVQFLLLSGSRIFVDGIIIE